MKTAFRRAAVLLAVLVPAVTLGAVPAHAATATLSLPYSGCQDSTGRNYDYVMRVHATSTRSYPDGGWIVVRVWGDDPSSDDLLLGPLTWSFEFWSGGAFLDMCVNRGTLNEDIGGDEIYAGVRFFDARTGQQAEVVESNRIYGSF
ncbi:MAG TPA: hypothetical protein VFC19_39105 [Candidatus Limnocylindrales bacterium]|nr:hypothetical protein [Candidatus Limnocylindrales bacterium]